jgi:hypothetical protein
MVHAMNFDPPDPAWLPLHEGILRLGHNADHEIERVCERVTALYPPVMLEYDPEDRTFYVSLARERDTASPYQFFVGSFRLSDQNFRFDDTAGEATSSESALVNEAVARFFAMLRIRLRIDYGKGFIVYARSGSPLAEKFSVILPDVFEHFQVNDWRRGVAIADNGERLFSIHLAPPPIADARQTLDPLDGQTKAYDVARFIRERFDSKRPSLVMGRLQQEYLNWKQAPQGKPPDRDTMNKGIRIAEQVAREGLGKSGNA